MNFKNGAVLLLAAMILLSGCIKQEYNQKIERDGSSMIQQITDFSPMVETMEEAMNETDGETGDVTEGLSEVCDKITDETISCSVDGLILTLEKKFTPEDGYYTFEVEQGLFNTYKVTVNKIPTDAFGDALEGEDFVDGATTSTQIVSLKDKTNAKQAAQTAALIGMEFTYVVEMPGSVTSATVDGGEYTPEVEGSTAKYDLVEVFDDSGPLVIESQELNVLWIGIILAVIVIAVLAFMYFKKK